ncbi:helix-turn-helix transcriptional regulator [Polaromonas sp. YR568]|uniref:helix-turn-helix domain-containing protein n=1 Tax=Polaromonas sp. YR568 TaxID=1855301 RepID=UPI0031378A65
MSYAAKSTNNFAKALKSTRKSKGLSQEDFSQVSSRTYVSTLERNIKSPTLSKVEVLAQVLGVHPLTLLTLAYLRANDTGSVNTLLGLVSEEIAELT